MDLISKSVCRLNFMARSLDNIRRTELGEGYVKGSYVRNDTQKKQNLYKKL